MKFPRFRDLPLALKIGFAPGFALLTLAVVAACALLSQHTGAMVLGSVVSDARLQSSLADDSKRITAANGKLYELMTAQAAGGSANASQDAINAVLTQLDTVKSSLQALDGSVPAAQRAGFTGVLSDLANYRGGVNVVGSMLGIDFNSAASFIQPFQANYARMTATLDATSTAIAAAAAARAAASTAHAHVMGELMIGFAAATLLIVATVSWIIDYAIRGSVAQISAATESLAGGKHDVDLEKLERRDEFGAIVRSLTVFRGNQRRIVEMQTAQEAAAAREEQARVAQERERAMVQAQQDEVVETLAGALASLAGGNLANPITHLFPPAYEKLRNDFNAAVAKLAEAMLAISGSVDAMTGGTAEISAAADDLSHRTEAQAANLEETAAAIDEVTAAVRQAAGNAEQAAEMAKAAKTRADESGEVAGRAIIAMGEINRFSGEISQIIGIIDEIAFQTNLLALNAGIEAARAGDAGRGFAVIATEVRALASRSGDSARQIKALMDSSGKSVGHGVELVNEMAISLTDILARVTAVSGLVADISLAAREQATGLASVNTAVNGLDKATQQNAAVAEQTSAASQQLADEAKVLNGLVARFQITQLAAPAAKARNLAPRRAEPVS